VILRGGLCSRHANSVQGFNPVCDRKENFMEAACNVAEIHTYSLNCQCVVPTSICYPCFYCGHFVEAVLIANSCQWAVAGFTSWKYRPTRPTHTISGEFPSLTYERTITLHFPVQLVMNNILGRHFPILYLICNFEMHIV
jgi:hypothetical protein